MSDSSQADQHHAFTNSFDLASVRLGGVVIDCSDDYFAEKDNLLKPHAAVWKEHEYTDRGKWMDGWESRRKRVAGYDWAIVRLGVPGIVKGFVVDTAWFRGNYPEACSIEATAAPIDARIETLLAPETEWVEVLGRSKLEGNSKNFFEASSPYAFTHVRLNIYPDGGVARLRVHGDVAPDWRRIGHARGEIDLAHVEHGGDVLVASDMFFGERRNLVMPGRAVNMSDGWETRRSRGEGHLDWAILRLGAPGAISRVELDTNHFRGNYPDTASLEACFAPGATDAELAALPEESWRELLPRTKLQAHTRHFFEPELAPVGRVTHVRLRVFPDGGVSRLRVFGSIADDDRRALGVARVNALTPRQAEAEFRAVCAASNWIQVMLAARPFASAERLLEIAERGWHATSEADWHEAFVGHPRIGERSSKTWSRQEQAGMNTADDALRAALAEANRIYEERFGFVYLVCATGKSAAELLAICESRLGNTRDDELKTAAAELGKINAIRLAKLIDP